MEAIFTSTGMMLKPYSASKAGMIYKARSVWLPAAHAPQPVTAYIETEPTTGGKRLLTYKCHPKWLQEQIPEIVITHMKANHVDHLGEPFALNPDIIPNDVQQAATQAVIDNGFKTAFFNIPTAMGKTLLAVYLTSILNVKSWAMCYRTIVLNQWQSTIAKMTTASETRLREIHSTKELLEMAEGDYPFDDYDMYFSTETVLTKFAKTYGLEMLNDVFNNAGIGVKFFDEAHRNVGNIVKINALTNVPRTYYLSADFGQADPERERLYLKMFGSTPIIRPTQEYAKSMQYTVAVLVKYNTHPSFNDVGTAFTKYGFNHNKFMEYELDQDNFYHAFANVVDSIERSNPDHKYKVLFLCTLIEHVNFLREWIAAYYEKFYPEAHLNIVRYHSEMSNEEKEEALAQGQIIVSTYQSMGVGVDLKMIRHVVGLTPINSIEDNQAAGRARPLPDGSDCFYYIFVDEGFEYVRKKLPNRLDYLQKQKIKKIVSIKYS